MQPLWFRNATWYAVDPTLFHDSDGDGWGDLAGLTARLEHIRGLGATALWLLPFYASPFRDGGYDVSDHLAVDPRLGDLAAVADLLERADELGIRVVVDLVAQHTSDQHRWFQEARRDRRSPFRDYYVWADEPEPTVIEPMFPTVQDSVWTWDDEAQQFYRHAFYHHEPDLDVANPAVREEIRRIMSFWLRMGVSGFRLDAAPYIMERAGALDARDDGLWYLRELRRFIDQRRPDAVLMGEVDVPPEQYADYFADGDGMHVLLNFWLNNHLFLALAREEAEPLARAVATQPVPTGSAQYVNWLRNHDELDLEQLTAAEREEVVETFAPEDSMRAYGRGIRRRLAPMLGGDARRIAMAHAVLMSLPGVPLMRYGDEIGMGEDLSRPERLAVRTPMQWSHDTNGGFSAAPADELTAPVIDDGAYGYQRVNVYDQTRSGDSLLARVSSLSRTRLGLREVGHGDCRVIDVECRSVLALRHDHAGSTVVTLVNLGARAIEVTIPDDDLSELVDVFADQPYPVPERGSAALPLQPYGYRWLRPRHRIFG